MIELLGETESLCPVCLRVIPARRVADGGDVYLEKSCPDHGPHKVLIWRDAELYHDWGSFGIDLGSPTNRLTDTVRGCPYDCGLCPTHKAETCIAVIELTHRCNLNCPICFANANEPYYEPDHKGIRGMFETLLHATSPCPVQLSGGEPTIRDDLPEIVGMGRKYGFDHIMVNTNGLRIANDVGYLHKLKDSGASLIYLQFDGVTDDIYRYTRGRNLWNIKVQAIENCAQVKIGVILVPTLIPGINDHQVGDVIQFAKKCVPIVKGIHFQPVSYFGRYPRAHGSHYRITIPDVLKAIETQTKGEIRAENFTPRKRKESYCAFAGFFILEDKKLLPTTNFKYAKNVNGELSHLKESPSHHARRFVQRRWRFEEVEAWQGNDCKPGSWQELFNRAKTDYLSISCMPFQDVWNIDLERLQRCCTHIVTPDKRIVPLCAFYVTSANGRRLQFNERG